MASNTTISSTNAQHSDQKAKAARNEPTRQNPPTQTCSFNVRICLDPGRCWYLSPWAGNAYHNHKKLGTGEKRRRMATLSQQQQFQAGIYSRHGTSSQTAGILHELIGNSFSSSQINFNKKSKKSHRESCRHPLAPRKGV